jgi:hypothetical protein
MVKIHKLKISGLKCFILLKFFQTTPVISKTYFFQCELFENDNEFIVESMNIPKSFCNTAWLSINSNARLLSFSFDLP